MTVAIRDIPYPIDDTHAGYSIGMHGWAEMSLWRANNKNVKWKKWVAEAGFFGNTLFSIVETVVRLPFYCLSNNWLSKKIVQGVCICLDQGYSGENFRKYIHATEKAKKVLIFVISQLFRIFIVCSQTPFLMNAI